MTREEMLSKYEAATAAEAYIIGFELNGELYTYYTNDLNDVADRIVLDRTSSKRGSVAKLRLRLDKLAKIRLAQKATQRGNISVIEYAGNYNAGDRFERYITEINGKVWAKNHTPFWAAGDIEINGKQVQIKYDGAEITNEKTLMRMA